MKKHFYPIFALFLVGVMFSCQSPKSNSTKEEAAGIDSMAPNPFITHMYTADPSAHVWADGRLYVYASHDIDPPRGCDLMDRYHVFSTDDMVNWTDHGEILNSSQVPWGRKEGGLPTVLTRMVRTISTSRIPVIRSGMIVGRSV